MGTSARRSLARPSALVPTSGITSDDDLRALLSHHTVGGQVLLVRPDGDPDLERTGVGRDASDAVLVGDGLGRRDLRRQCGGVGHGLLGRVDEVGLVGDGGAGRRRHVECRGEQLDEVGQAGVDAARTDRGQLGLGVLEHLRVVGATHNGALDLLDEGHETAQVLLAGLPLVDERLQFVATASGDDLPAVVGEVLEHLDDEEDVGPLVQRRVELGVVDAVEQLGEEVVELGACHDLAVHVQRSASRGHVAGDGDQFRAEVQQLLIGGRGRRAGLEGHATGGGLRSEEGVAGFQAVAQLLGLDPELCGVASRLLLEAREKLGDGELDVLLYGVFVPLDLVVHCGADGNGERVEFHDGIQSGMVVQFVVHGFRRYSNKRRR